MDKAIDCGGGRHRVFEDPVPLAEHKVAGDHHGAPLVALGEECKENLHLVTALLDVAKVIEDDGVEAVEDLQLFFEAEIAFGGEQPLHEGERRDEEHAVAALDQLVTDRADQMCLAASWPSKREQIVAALDEA